MNSVMIYTVKRQNSIMTSKSEPVDKEAYTPKVIEGFIKGNKNKKKDSKKNKYFVQGQVVSYFYITIHFSLRCHHLLLRTLFLF